MTTDPTLRLDKLAASDFLPHLHQPFVIRLDDGTPYPLELVGVIELGEAHMPGWRRPFSLEFNNPRRDAYLPQRIYRLECENMGALELFLVPLGPQPEGMRYEAIIS
jgi:hypothetical protein